MAPPNPPSSNSGKLGGVIALITTGLLLLLIIVLSGYSNASSGIITALGLIVGVLSTFFSFLQTFPGVSKQVANIFSIRPSFSFNNNRLPLILTGLVIILLVLNIVQARIIFKPNVSQTPTNTPVTHSTTSTIVATSLVTPTPTFTATTTTPSSSPTGSSPVVNLLYQANWSQGMNGWSGDAQWSTTNGMLTSSGDAQGKDYVVAPYQPTTSNYAVEAQIQFLRFTSFPMPNLFGLFVRSGFNEDTMGYDGYIYDGFAKIRIAHDPNSEVLASTHYPLDTSWHTYRLEVKDSIITLFIDGKERLYATDSTFTTAGFVGLFDNSCQINVRSFTVTQL